ncbi:MAG TPA: hypothetical protein VMT57_04060 [Candidatus Thermoplasmatota archaeon]|nr:hypothetical protein [Candidatus Thermoplasmatota archaeon]
MNLGRVVVVALVLLVSACSGCTLFSRTRFTLLSWTVNDDKGFPGLRIQFNTSDTATLTLSGPTDQVLFSDEYYQGVHHENVSFAGYRRDPSHGTYTLRAYDTSKNVIFQNQMAFHGQNLSIDQVQDDWWSNATGSYLVALHLALHNLGDLPSYPSRVTATLEDVTVQGLLLPIAVLPHQTATVSCFVLLGPFTSKGKAVTISLVSGEGTVLAKATHVISSPAQVASWTYTWDYHGEQTLRIPSLNWLAEYYKGMSRLDINDDAPYVFDPYDDTYMEFLAHELLSMSHAHSDVERIDFIASFVQSIPYLENTYPTYPLELLKDDHGDCDDKSILGASLLTCLGYNVSLIRLPHHMAVGVSVNASVGSFAYYVDRYYYLEMTAMNSPLGRVPPEFNGFTNETVYPIATRPLLVHSWLNATRYTTSGGPDYIRLKILVMNLGSIAAPSFEVQGAFYDVTNRSYNEHRARGSPLAPQDEQIIDFEVNVPKGVATVLRTRIYLQGFMVHERESSSWFQ